MDADFGLQFADDVRREVAPILGQLTVPQLARLTSGLKSGLGRLPTFESIARNEHSNFLEGVQWIQDRYEKREFDKIDEMLGTPVRDATTYLKQIPQDDFKRRSSYFQGFADEAELVADWTAAESTKPVLKRKEPKSIPYAAERPWRRYAAQLFTSLTPVQARYDATLSRTRMLILASEINRQIKVSRRAPKTLGAFSLPLRTDPITGSEFKYRATGMEFYLYSVGLNFQDDQGQTDSVFSSPDMTLETAVD